MTPLQNRLVLHRFVCREFGQDDMYAMLERLHGFLAAVSAGRAGRGPAAGPDAGAR